VPPTPSVFPHLSQPLDLGSVTLRNRIVMGSMHTGVEGRADPEGFDLLARFYAGRARGGVGLIVTGGFAPNRAGRLKDEPTALETSEQAGLHRRITRAVHDEGGRIALQIVHSGRYGYHDGIVAPSPLRSPINRHAPAEMSEETILETIRDYARTARLAREAGYDGVEIMGSEGYLVSQFLAPCTNHREDGWGGPLEARMRFPVAVVEAVRAAAGPDFLIVYRHSVLDLVEGGLPWEETVLVARAVARAGADVVSTGIGWHESKVPTIAGIVPHAAFADAIARLKAELPVPVTASNRINSPGQAEALLASGAADLVSMARPFLADADFVNKALAGDAALITTCIACNQACLDHYFEDRVISCLVNPRAAPDAEYRSLPAPRRKRVAVVGAGMAGLVCAIEAKRRGHDVTVFEAEPRIGGQMNLAARIPGKEDYARAIAAYGAQLARLGVPVVLGRRVTAAELAGGGFEEVVAATGIRPRALDLPGADDPRVLSYEDALSGRIEIGGRVVVIGAGGIGHDVALFLAHPGHGGPADRAAFARRWGVQGEPHPLPARREVTLVKRSPGPFGRGLGRSTGWILRQELRDLGVRQIAGATYLRIDKEGLHLEARGERRCLPADAVVVCAGQIPERGLADELAAAGLPVHVIGGARLATELDARRAAEEGMALGCAI
jgi:2,4-dienoyl-CoA reductase (NADPH2)